MKTYDVTDEVIVAVPPDRVWGALLAELAGRTRYWHPHNTFEPGPVGPGHLGGETRVTVHTRGEGRRGLRLRFLARTTEVEPGRRLRTRYVEGAFLGTATFEVVPLDGGSRTKLTMRFVAAPQGFFRRLAKVVDMGEQHSIAARHAFEGLRADLEGSSPSRTRDANHAVVRG